MRKVLVLYKLVLSSVQFILSVMSDSLQPHGLQHTRLPARHQLLELNQTYSIESGMPSNHFILCHPLLLLPAIFPSIRVFPNESVLPIRWPEYLSFSFSISPSGEYSGLISFRMVWLDLLAVQGTLSTVFSNTTLQSVSSLVLSFLYSPTLTSLHDYWKNHSFAYTDHCWQSNVSAF